MNKKMPDLVSAEKLDRIIGLGEAYSLLMSLDVPEENISFFVSDEHESACAIISQQPDAGTPLMPETEIAIGVNGNIRNEFNEELYKSRILYALKYGTQEEQKVALTLIKELVEDLRIQAETSPYRWASNLRIFQEYWGSFKETIEGLGSFPNDVFILSDLLVDSSEPNTLIEILADIHYINLVFSSLSHNFRRRNSVLPHYSMVSGENNLDSIRRNQNMHYLARVERNQQLTFRDLATNYLNVFVKDFKILITSDFYTTLEFFRNESFVIAEYVNLLQSFLNLDFWHQEIASNQYKIVYGSSATSTDLNRMHAVHHLTIPLKITIKYEALSSYAILDLPGSCELDKILLGS